METLAEKLGLPVHESALLKKVDSLGLSSTQALNTLVVQRGCFHYSQGNEPAGELVSREVLRNEELALALLNVARTYDHFGIRSGAAILSDETNDPDLIAFLSKTEHSEYVVRYVAECGKNYEPEEAFWDALLCRLPPITQPVRSSVMPHPTRFIALMGKISGELPAGQYFQWLRPKSRPPRNHLAPHRPPALSFS